MFEQNWLLSLALSLSLSLSFSSKTERERVNIAPCIIGGTNSNKITKIYSQSLSAMMTCALELGVM